MEKKIINILGTNYEIVMNAPVEMLPPNSDGAMDHSIKQITIAELKPNEESVKDLESYRKKVLRHEIIHAFFYESGIWSNSHDVAAYGTDEELTDWLAIQSPKIFKAFKEAECL